ncbi:transcriptional regulator, DeoR family [Austwickia chelonae]|uniref:Putative transcriptional regulator n=1 Tax=Austwickia chelonae NBRC 105200 TaxID=1184607 RepID=K6W4V4_9MICO|nr:DeoR/GlpR family DNA-binding transcription regulator [Austwickia chelonae]GAB76852.1 putative transcriptional regulator [Austwickia chelonae NBRC 105200]SEW31570.1 transcriptional regulator, DeoR family [Austwickia chelonae]
MRLNDRQRMILGRLRSGEYMEVKVLAGHLEVDTSTIRRDLQALARADLVERLHGGVRIRPEADPRRAESTDPAREQRRHASVARTVRGLLTPGQCLALSGGPVSEALLPLLLDLEELTVVTNDLRTADILARQATFRVHIAGGELREGNGPLVTSGPATADFFADHPTDWALVEVDGIHPDSGYTTTVPGRVSAQRGMLRAGRQRCVLATGSAFGARHAGFIAPLAEADLVVTDRPPQDPRPFPAGLRMLTAEDDPR